MSYYFSKIIEAPFSEAVARAKAALSAHGFGVLSEIDVAATLKAKLGADVRACSRKARSPIAVDGRFGARL